MIQLKFTEPDTVNTRIYSIHHLACLRWFCPESEVYSAWHCEWYE